MIISKRVVHFIVVVYKHAHLPKSTRYNVYPDGEVMQQVFDGYAHLVVKVEDSITNKALLAELRLHAPESIVEAEKLHSCNTL